MSGPVPMSPSTAPDSTVSQEVRPVLLQEWSQEVMGLSMQEQHLCTKRVSWFQALVGEVCIVAVSCPR